MWLTLDIGNSTIKGGFFSGPRLERAFRLPTSASEAAWQAALGEQFDDVPITRAGIASVVPARTTLAQATIRAVAETSAEVIGASMKLPFAMAYETPHTLGTDRLAAAAAAWTQHGATATPPRSVIALDAGTALTFDVVRADGVFLGGSIGPGPDLLVRALHTGTAQLPDVPLVLPGQPIGRATQEAIQIGVMWGFLESTRGLLHRLTETLGDSPFVVATGGWGALLAEQLADVHLYDPHLVLRGVRVLLEWNDETVL